MRDYSEIITLSSSHSEPSQSAFSEGLSPLPHIDDRTEFTRSFHTRQINEHHYTANSTP